MNFKSAFILSLLCGSLFACSTSKAGTDNEATATRDVTVEPFTAIETSCVGNIILTQGSQQSLRVEGTPSYVKDIEFNVRKGKLFITAPGHTPKRCKVYIYITAPTVRTVNITGVGNFSAKTLSVSDLDVHVSGVGNVTLDNLKCQNLKVDMNGVGNMNATINCSGTLDADISGVGNVEFKGYAAQGSFRKDGVGKLNTKELRIGNGEQSGGKHVHYM
jgi:hypothetical protein